MKSFKTLHAFLPRATRARLRKIVDSLFCAHWVPVLRVGGESSWVVIADRLVPGANVLSGGAGNDISFEIELAAKYRCRVAVFDPSPTGAATFQNMPTAPSGLTCHLEGLAGATSEAIFLAPRDPVEGSYTAVLAQDSRAKTTFKCLSPKDAMRAAGLRELELLKVDIEGFEYEFLRTAMRDGLRPVQIAVEFHHFIKGISIRQTLGMILLLHECGYRLVHKNRYDYLFVQSDALKDIRIARSTPP